MNLSAMVKASGQLILITEIAPVPLTIAGAHIGVVAFKSFSISDLRVGYPSKIADSE